MTIAVQITVDAADPDRLAEFWAEALGYDLHDRPDLWPGYHRKITDPAGARAPILFLRVPEPKTVKNRVHIDLYLPHSEDEPPSFDERRQQLALEVERLIEAGASRIGEGGAEDDFWTVMADPEGNEFCIG